jgi:hypothetical protein
MVETDTVFLGSTAIPEGEEAPHATDPQPQRAWPFSTVRRVDQGILQWRQEGARNLRVRKAG